MQGIRTNFGFEKHLCMFMRYCIPMELDIEAHLKNLLEIRWKPMIDSHEIFVFSDSRGWPFW